MRVSTAYLQCVRKSYSPLRSRAAQSDADVSVLVSESNELTHSASYDASFTFASDITIYNCVMALRTAAKMLPSLLPSSARLSTSTAAKAGGEGLKGFSERESVSKSRVVIRHLHLSAGI